jgi:hypothetical protein
MYFRTSKSPKPANCLARQTCLPRVASLTFTFCQSCW